MSFQDLVDDFSWPKVPVFKWPLTPHFREFKKLTSFKVFDYKIR